MSIVNLPLPIQLINGNVADAGQVMQDLNYLASNVNANAAKNGVNNDITSLLALTTLNPGLTITGASITNSTISGGTMTSTVLSNVTGTLLNAIFNGGQIIGAAIGGTTTGVTQPVGTNTTQLATMAALLQATFQASLPAQPGGPLTYILQSKNSLVSWVLFFPPVGSTNYLYLTAGGF